MVHPYESLHMLSTSIRTMRLSFNSETTNIFTDIRLEICKKMSLKIHVLRFLFEIFNLDS